MTSVHRERIGISWEVPESDGGAEITKYIIEKRDAAKNIWIKCERVNADQLAYTVEKLIENKEYFFRVSAENEIGVSDPVETPNPTTAKMPFGKISIF